VLKAFRSTPGHLTRLGEQEQTELAHRIYKRYKPVFKKGGKKVRVESSTVPRVLVSMASFTNELTRMQPDLEYTMDSDDSVFYYIGRSDSDKNRNLIYRRVDSISNATVVDSVRIYQRLFTDPAKGKALAPDADSFQKDIWRTAKIAKACGVDGSPYEFLTEDVIYKWWSHYTRSTYLRHCNSVEYGAERRLRSIPLAKVVFAHAEEALASGEVAADLLFGHDYPLLGLVSWFRLEGVGQTLRFNEILEKWNDPTTIPFASNVQMVLYRSRKEGAPLLVKFVYNGRERAVEGLTPVSGPYYKWEDLCKAYKPE